MNQEQLRAKRDELAQEYHLGELELYCTPMTYRGLAIRIGVLVGLIFLPAIITIPMWTAMTPLDLQLVVILVTAMLIMPMLISFFIYLINDPPVYLYTNGLVCFRRSGGLVVHWEEIRKVRISSNEIDTYLSYELNDGTTINFPFMRSRGSASDKALHMFIEEKMAQTSRIPDQ